MAYTPIPKLTPDWDEPLNAALVDQDARITDNAAGIASLVTSVGNLQIEVDAVETDVAALDGRLTTAETDINNLEAADVVLDGRLDTAEPKITTLEGQMSTAQADITNLQGRMTTAETDINNLEAADVSLDGRLDTAEATLISLDTRLDTAEANITTNTTNIATNAADIRTIGASAFDLDDYDYVTWTQEPSTATQQTQPDAPGDIHFSLMKITESVTVNSLSFAVAQVPTSTTAGQCFAAIYNTAGTRLAVTADISSSFSSTGLKTVNFTSSAALTPGYYWGAVLWNGTATTPLLMVSGGGGVGSLLNTSSVSPDRCTRLTGQTSMPANVASFSAITTRIRWMGLT